MSKETEPESCETCRFCLVTVHQTLYSPTNYEGQTVEKISDYTSYFCRRFPEGTQKQLNHWCGEYQREEKTK